MITRWENITLKKMEEHIAYKENNCQRSPTVRFGCAVVAKMQ